MSKFENTALNIALINNFEKPGCPMGGFVLAVDTIIILAFDYLYLRKWGYEKQFFKTGEN